LHQELVKNWTRFYEQVSDFSITFLETRLWTIRTTLITVGCLFTQRRDGGEKRPKDRVKTG
jgi:hypothetical protein